MKVSELTGAELDWYVAKAEGIENVELRTAQRATNRICVVKASGGRQFDYTYSPSTQWNVGGPIIEREKMSIGSPKSSVHRNGGNNPGWGESGLWCATTWHKGFSGKRNIEHDETSPLVAAMRCYVASKFGEEVEDI